MAGRSFTSAEAAHQPPAATAPDRARDGRSATPGANAGLRVSRYFAALCGKSVSARRLGARGRVSGFASSLSPVSMMGGACIIHEWIDIHMIVYFQYRYE